MQTKENTCADMLQKVEKGKTQDVAKTKKKKAVLLSFKNQK